MQLGLGRVSLDRAARYAKERVVFDRPIGQNQGIQFPLADSLAHRRDAWFETTLWLLLQVLGVLPLLGWLVHLVTRRGLAPLA